MNDSISPRLDEEARQQRVALPGHECEAVLGLAAQVARAVEAVVGERGAGGRLVAEVAGHEVGPAKLDLLVAHAHLDRVGDRPSAGERALLGRGVARRVGHQRLHLRRPVALIEGDAACLGGVDERPRLQVERGEAGLAQRARVVLQQPPGPSRPSRSCGSRGARG